MRLRDQEQLLDLDHQIDLLQNDLDRKEQQYKIGAIPEIELQKARKDLAYSTDKRVLLLQANELDLALLDQEAARTGENIDIMRLDLQRIRDRLANLTIVAPAYGQITALDASVGEAKNAGSRIAKLDLMDTLKMKANLEEFYLPKVEVGKKASFTYLAANADEVPSSLTLSWISPDVKNNSFDVEFKFDGMPPNIRIGQRFLIRVELGKDAGSGDGGAGPVPAEQRRRLGVRPRSVRGGRHPAGDFHRQEQSRLCRGAERARARREGDRLRLFGIQRPGKNTHTVGAPT